MRAAIVVVLLAGCVHKPVMNQLSAKAGRHPEFKEMVASATLCKTCGKDSPVVITFGTPAKVTLTIPSCYPHAASKIGDHDHVQVALSLPDKPAEEATAGELDIDECLTKYIVAKVWATFPSGMRIEAAIDTPFSDPGAAATK